MKRNCISFPTEIEAVEVLIGYDYDETNVPGDEFVQSHELLYVELTSVEIVSNGIGTDILPALTSQQKAAYVRAINLNHYDSISQAA